MRSIRLAFVVSMALAVSQVACAGAGPRERELTKLAQFERFAGEPVDSFQFWEMDHREALGPEHFAVWTKINEAFLIQVKQPCPGLEFARGVALTSTAHRVHRRFDAVLVDDQRCLIQQIRPIDAKALKAERRGETHPSAEASSGG